jgi:hypothetical protein
MMPNTILFVSVGGSPAPVVTDIESVGAELARVVFIATHDSRVWVEEGKDGKPSIVAQARIESVPHEIVEVAADDFHEIFSTTHQRMERLRREHPDATILCGYTGGTKTMAVALAVAGLETPTVRLQVVTGERHDLIKVRDGTHGARAVNIDHFKVQRYLQQFRERFDAFDYAGALAIRDLANGMHASAAEAVPELRLGGMLTEIYDAWDRFDHDATEKLVDQHGQRKNPLFADLGRIIASKIPRSGGYAKVFDLLNNAERRAHQQRYDDAVARIYRMVEMLAQVRLQNGHNIDTGKVLREQLQDDEQPDYLRAGQESAQIGLMQAYALLARRADPLGSARRQLGTRLDRELKRRNMSILAHGDTACSQRAYQRLLQVARELMEGARKAGVDFGTPTRQFPQLAEALAHLNRATP